MLPANTHESAPRGPRPRDPAPPRPRPGTRPRPDHAPGTPPRPGHAPLRHGLSGSSRGCAPATFPGFAALSPLSTHSRDVPYGPGRPLLSPPGASAPTMRPAPETSASPGQGPGLLSVQLLLALRVWASYPVKGRRPAGLRAQGLPAPGPAAWPPGGPRAAAAAPKMPHVLRTFCPGYMWPFGTKLASAQLPPEKVDVNVIFMNLEAISM